MRLGKPLTRDALGPGTAEDFSPQERTLCERGDRRGGRVRFRARDGVTSERIRPAKRGPVRRVHKTHDVHTTCHAGKAGERSSATPSNVRNFRLGLSHASRAFFFNFASSLKVMLPHTPSSENGQRLLKFSDTIYVTCRFSSATWVLASLPWCFDS